MSGLDVEIMVSLVENALGQRDEYYKPSTIEKAILRVRSVCMDDGVDLNTRDFKDKVLEYLRSNY